MDVKYQYVSEPSNHTRSHQAMKSEKNKRNYLSGLSITASLLQGQRFIPQSQVTDTRNLFFFFLNVVIILFVIWCLKNHQTLLRAGFLLRFRFVSYNKMAEAQQVAQPACATHVMDRTCSALRPSAHAGFTTVLMVFVLDKLFLLLVFICC